MPKTIHYLYITIFVVIIMIAFTGLAFHGVSYYRQSQEERFYHPNNNTLKPSGSIGHGLGIAGSLCILIGVGTYMARKRYLSLAHLGLLKYWLEFHIFICILGTILIVFHTAFKVGGLAAVSFWSMITVFASGVAGRVIYLQIPRTIEGRELDLMEIRGIRNNIIDEIKASYNIDDESLKFITYSVENQAAIYQRQSSFNFIKRYFEERNSIKAIKGTLREHNLSKSQGSKVLSLVRDDIRLGRRIGRLENMKNLFRYWHIFHLPFAILMLIFMVMHVIVVTALGYRWLF